MKLTPEKKLAFLAALSATGSVSKACIAIDMSRAAIYEWRDEDQDFADRWAKAKAVGMEALEDEALRRAHDGTMEHVWHQGTAVGTIQKYSDTLAIFLLKGAMPEKYRDNHKVELNGRLEVTDMTETEMRAELALLAAEGILPTTVDDGSDLV